MANIEDTLAIIKTRMGIAWWEQSMGNADFYQWIKKLNAAMEEWVEDLKGKGQPLPYDDQLDFADYFVMVVARPAMANDYERQTALQGATIDKVGNPSHGRQ